MHHWLNRLGGPIDWLETRLDRLKPRQRHPLHIVAYTSYATAQRVQLWGRVQADKGITPADTSASVWENIRNMYRRFNTDEVPGAAVEAQVNGQTMRVVADAEGYFNTCMRLDAPLPVTERWHTVTFTLRAVPAQWEPLQTVTAQGRVLLPPESARFGVISDLDDTVIQTDVLHYIRLVRNMLLHNAHTRLPFDGVAQFYQALRDGIAQDGNPIFYLSKSPWNLYDLLIEFLQVQGIPAGPLLLTDMGFSPGQFLTPTSAAHKLTYIQALLDMYPHLPFVLIGDSGQQDPEVYTQAAVRNPGRIPAIYIRDVTRPLRDQQVLALQSTAQAAGTELLLVEETRIAQAHAQSRGFVGQ